MHPKRRPVVCLTGLFAREDGQVDRFDGAGADIDAGEHQHLLDDRLEALGRDERVLNAAACVCLGEQQSGTEDQSIKVEGSRWGSLSPAETPWGSRGGSGGVHQRWLPGWLPCGSP